MPELNLAALNVAPAPSASPSQVRGQDAQPAQDETGAASFGEVIEAAHARTDPADEAGATSKAAPNAKKTASQRHELRKPKADVAAAKRSETPDAADPAVGILVANMTAADLQKGPGTDKSAREQVASVLATIAASAQPVAADPASPKKPGVDVKGLDQVAGTLAADGRVAKRAPSGEAAADNTDGKDAVGDPTAGLGQRAQTSRPDSAANNTETPREFAVGRSGAAPAATQAAHEPDGSAGAGTRRNAAEAIARNVIATPAAPTAHGAGDAGQVSPAIGQAAVVRDRLLEDFQQRFERALTSAPASTASSARSDAGEVHSAAAPAWGGISPLGTPPNSVIQITVPTPVGTAAFAEDLSQRVSLLTRGKVHSAELSLTPADLGPVTVSIEVRGREATLVFGAAHEATRAAITEALPRLREMLDAQGLQLADARVGTQAGDTTPRHGDRPQPARPTTPVNEVAATDVVTASSTTQGVTVRSTRLIDVIA